MSFNPYAPYGPLASSRIRVVTWDVWGRYGADREARQAALEQTLEQTAPDLVCLVEAWHQGESTQPGRVAARRGGVGHPTRCSLLGVRAPGEQQVSDHYGLAADLRY
jgi:endonuclease/exonuclease/phosphatase family metal-dependent hydrolase